MIPSGTSTLEDWLDRTTKKIADETEYNKAAVREALLAMGNEEDAHMVLDLSAAAHAPVSVAADFVGQQKKNEKRSPPLQLGRRSSSRRVSEVASHIIDVEKAVEDTRKAIRDKRNGRSASARAAGEQTLEMFLRRIRNCGEAAD